ncbi:2-hydroxyacid dehydrogenase, partial [Phytophthora fragariae]
MTLGTVSSAAKPHALFANDQARTKLFDVIQNAQKSIKIAFFSSHSYDMESMERVAKEDGILPKNEIQFLAPRLDADSAKLAEGCEGVCIFVNDVADEAALRVLHAGGTRVIFLRCAGFDMVDLKVAKELGMPVIRVPAYSPYVVAEHAASLMMVLNRKIHRSFNRTRELNFRLSGLLGFDVHGKTVGIVGTGKIGALFARIAAGFGAKVLGYDVVQNPEALSYGVEYVSLDEIWARLDIISLHIPLFPSTKHVINAQSIAKMKSGVMLINTSRGGLIDTKALVNGLESKKIGAVGLDVFEGEGEYFYSDHSGTIIADDDLARLFTFPNVIITGHQAFFTKEAVDNIAHTTMSNIKAYVRKEPLVN